MTRAERELLFTLARIVLSRIAESEPGGTTDEEARALTASLAERGRPAAAQQQTEAPQQETEAPQDQARMEAIRALVSKATARGAAAAPPEDDRPRWANGQPVSNEDMGLGK